MVLSELHIIRDPKKGLFGNLKFSLSGIEKLRLRNRSRHTPEHLLRGFNDLSRIVLPKVSLVEHPFSGACDFRIHESFTPEGGLDIDPAIPTAQAQYRTNGRSPLSS